MPVNFYSLPEDVQKRILDSMAEASQAGVKSKFSPDIFKESVNKSGAITPAAAIPDKYLLGAEGGITDSGMGTASASALTAKLQAFGGGGSSSWEIKNPYYPQPNPTPIPA